VPRPDVKGRTGILKVHTKKTPLSTDVELEQIALADEYFLERRLYPNVDFYTGLIYKAMGFPTKMFTVLFALGRLPGWIAHWRELMADADTKIGRPRQVYVGPAERAYDGIGLLR